MTCFECEKCGATTPNFKQQQAYYNEHGELYQVFKCMKCGEEKHVDAKCSAVVMPVNLFPKVKLVCPHCEKEIQI